mgnify:FL=1
MKTRIGILGYGNLGRGIESAIKQSEDLELVAVFTRRDPASVKIHTEQVPVVALSEALNWKDKIDVMVLCGGSATDLPTQTPEYAKHFNVINSFDTHAKIPSHFEAVDAAAKEGGKLALISLGWDPGLFSLNRMLATAILPQGKNYTFWGKGVSQGHSDAVRRIAGVLDARQYTIPVESAMTRIRKGEQPEFTAREMHKREVFVVAAEDADRAAIEAEIKNMPNYFADYDTEVQFITAEEMREKHAELPHGGFVIRSGVSGFHEEHKELIEFSLKLDSNPEFTGAVLAAYARAAHRLAAEGQTGCKTIFDVAPSYLSPLSAEELRAKLL